MSNISITDQNNDHKYFSILQNVLSRIGLTAFERSVYWAIKECAGEKGSCTKSYAKLSEMAGLSIPSLKRTLNSLSEENKFLKKPLIKITNRLTEYGDWDTNEIVLVDIWNDNNAVFKKNIGQITQTPPQIRKNSPQVTRTQGVRSHRAEGEVTQSYNKEPLNKNPMNKTSSSSVPHKKMEEVVELDKRIFNLIEDCKKREFPFSAAALLSIFKETSGPSLEAALKKFSKRSKNLKPLDLPDAWLKKNAIAEHEFELQKKEAQGLI